MKKETRRETEEQKYEKELKNFLFGIAERIESADPAKQKNVIQKIREEYNSLGKEFQLLVGQNSERYSELVRNYAPVLYSCTVMIQFYEKEYDSWNHERRKSGNHMVPRR